MKENKETKKVNKTKNNRKINDKKKKKSNTKKKEKENSSIVKYRKNYYLDYLYNKTKNSDQNSVINYLNKIMSNIIEFLFDKITKWVNIVGPLFVNAFMCFFFLGYHSFLYNLIPYWSSSLYYKNKTKIFYYIFYTIICPLYTQIYFLLLLYYILTVIIKPGSVEDLKRSKKFKNKINPYYCYDKIPNLSYILRMGNFNYSAEKIKKFPYCKICKEIKPLRAHHCSVCRKCHLRMDHHCPWVNNCIGLSNFRYFVLFLFYLWVICVFNTILSIKPFFSLKRFEYNNELSFVTIIGMCGIAISSFFNIWYWSMIAYNKTSIEFWQGRLRSKNWLVKSFSMKTFKDNLYFTFCDKNLFKILLIPSFKSLDISGLEWSKIAEPSFEIKGIKNNIDLL